jgi:AcrR family transcriptional regulator
VHGFSLAEASRQAGVSVAAPYKHFADRDALLAELARQGYEGQLERFGAAMAAVADPAAQMAEFAAAYVRFSVESRAQFELIFGAGLAKARYPDLVAAGERVEELLVEPARALRATPHEARDLVHTVAAAAHGLAVFLGQGVFGDPTDQLAETEDRARAAAQALAEGLASRGAA